MTVGRRKIEKAPEAAPRKDAGLKFIVISDKCVHHSVWRGVM